MDRPALRRGKRVPFHELDPSSFEQFVRGVLTVIGHTHGLTRVQTTGQPTDDGFDAVARRTSDNALVSIQCKRYAKPFGLADVGLELAKVALQAFADGSSVHEHWFVTSGDLAKVLSRANRENSRASFKQSATEALKQDELKPRREVVVQRGGNPHEVVSRYIDQLDHIVLWDSVRLDEECQREWASLGELLERFFALDVVLREHPRPNFDEHTYIDLQSVRQPGMVSLVWSVAEQPASIRQRSAANPLKPTREEATADAPIGGAKSSVSPRSVVEQLLETRPGSITLLVGRGGAGKTTTLQMTSTEAAHRRIDGKADTPLPIQVDLSSYTGNLDELVHSTLRITHGNWRSLAGPILLLCDGLDLVRAEHAPTLARELGDVLTDGEISCVLSSRPSGARRVIILSRLERTLELAPLSFPNVRTLARTHLKDDAKVRTFLEEFRKRLGAQSARLLGLPFGLMLAIEAFRQTGRIPADDTELVGAFVDERLNRDAEVPALETGLAAVPPLLLKQLAGRVAFEVRVSLGASAVDTQEFSKILKKAQETLVPEWPEAAEFSIAQARDLLAHHELVTKGDGRWRFTHDIIADWLAAPLVAQQWRELVKSRRVSDADESYIFAATHVPHEEQLDYVKAVAASDLVVGASCARRFGGASLQWAEDEAIRLLASEDPIQVRAACFALSAIRTDRSLDALMKRVGKPVGPMSSLFAEHALARAGHLEYLRNILPEADTFAYLGFSGGTLGTWRRAQPAAALALARARLASEPSDAILVESVRTLGRFGDDSDVAVLEKLFDDTPRLEVALACFHALHALSPEKAIQAAQRARGANTRSVAFRFVQALALVGEPVDVPFIMDLLCAEVPKDENDARDLGQAQNKAAELLSQLPTRTVSQPQLVDVFQRVTGSTRNLLWMIARAHPGPEIDRIAVQSFDLGSAGERGNIAWYMRQSATEGQVKELIATRCRAWVQEPWNDTHAWGRVQALLLLLETGERVFVSSRVEQELVRLLGLQRAKLAQPAPTTLPAIDAELDIILLLPVAAKVVDLLPIPLIEAIARARLTSMSDDARNSFKALLQRLGPERLDGVLAAEMDSLWAAQLLELTSSPTNEQRLAVLTRVLQSLGWHPAVTQPLKNFVQNTWDAAVAKAVFTAFAAASWEEHGAQLAAEFVEEIAQHMGEGMFVAVLDELIANANTTQFGRQILKLLRDIDAGAPHT